MLPALTFRQRQIPARRIVAGALGIALLAASAAGALTSSPSPAAGTLSSGALTERLADASWALAVPAAWLAAPLPEVRAGDSVDFIAVRTGERPIALPIAADLRVMIVDERSIVFEVDEESATAIAIARASGLLIVPLLRSAR